MRTRVYKNLLIMGIFSVLAAFILSIILYYQGLQEQFSKDLERMTGDMALALSVEEQDRGREYLTQIFEAHGRRVHIVWLDAAGKVLYDSDGVTDEDYKSGPEVKEALEYGKGSNIHKSAEGYPKSYFAERVPDGSILRISAFREVLFRDFSNYFPEIMLFLFVFFAGCLAAAERLTEQVLRPFHMLGELVQQIMEGKNPSDMADYKELRPLIQKVEEQRNDIQNYLEDIEEDRHTIRTVIDTISDGIILLNANKEILDYNKSVEALFGFGENKRYRRISNMYHDEDWLRCIGKAFREGGKSQYTMQISDKPYQVIMKNMEINEGENVLLIVLHDLTESYASEKMRREFSANVSHELKTPLTSISGYAEMIANGMYQSEADVRVFGNRIMNESQRMMSLIETIMHLSKIEETETTISWKAVALDSLIRYAADLVMPQASAKNVTVHVEAEPLYTYGNAALLSELILNLLDNGIKYNNESGNILVKLAPEGEDKVILTVSDTGIGIPKEKQGRVFERFYRAEESRNQSTGGSGLGLAICKHIVQKHKGEMFITSEEGSGTTVTVILPRVADADVFKETEDFQAAKQEAAEEESACLEQLEQGQDGKNPESKSHQDKKQGKPKKLKKEKTRDKKEKKDKKKTETKPDKQDKAEHKEDHKDSHKKS